MKHIIIRILMLLLGFVIAIPIGLSMLNPERRCSTGDVFAVFFWMLIFYIIWSIGLIVESILLHRKAEVIKRNFNIVLISILPICSFLIWIYFLIADSYR